MAKKDDNTDEVSETGTTVDVPSETSNTSQNKSVTKQTVAETPTTSSGTQPGYKIITNLQPCQQHIPLSNGTGIDLGPWLSPTRSSAPVPGKLLNKEFMKRMVHLKRLRIDE